MIEIETYKKRMISAIANTCVGVIFLMILLRSSEEDGYKGFFAGLDVFDIVISILITVLVCVSWIRFVLTYVDFAIKEMKHERKMAEIVIQEKINQLKRYGASRAKSDTAG